MFCDRDFCHNVMKRPTIDRSEAREASQVSARQTRAKQNAKTTASTHLVANQCGDSLLRCRQNFRMLKLRAKTFISPDFTGVKSLFLAYS
jgi:hypothetical protein